MEQQFNRYTARVKPTGPDKVTLPKDTAKCIGFLTNEQSHQLADLVCSALRRGDGPPEIEQQIKDWLRELPEGLLEKHGWQVDALAELLTVAGLLAEVAWKNRSHFS